VNHDMRGKWTLNYEKMKENGDLSDLTMKND
jgi:hypothetical protein